MPGTISRRESIGAAFGRARDYDAHARVQARAALRLAQAVAALDLPPRPRVLEIGCGTGFLTQALAKAMPAAQLLITDLAPAMVERARERVGEAPSREFAVLDGEHGPMPMAGHFKRAGPFDLIVSSLTFQWFDDLAGAAERLCGWLAPGGHLVFSTLASGTFAEWRAAHASLGLEPGTLPFPTAAALGAMVLGHKAAEPVITHDTESYGGARAFLAALKGIGAATPRPGHNPLPPGALRRVAAAFDQAGAHVTYEIAICHYRRKEQA